MYKQKTFQLKKESVDRKWYVVDATDKVVGRLATQIADLLRGKNKPTYTPHVDSGDFVVVVNADKVRFTGKKLDDKVYYWHTNHIGGIKKRTAKEQLENHPDRVITKAVKRMMPKNTLSKKQLTKLKVFAGSEHEHEAQNPQKIEL